MIVNTIFIVGSCGNTECVSAVGLIPEVDPIPERHIRLDFIGRASALIFQLFQLCTAFRFRLGGYAFCNRLTFLVVVYNNPAFPPPAFFSSCFILRYATGGAIGSSGQIGSANIHSETAFFLRSLNTFAVLSGR